MRQAARVTLAAALLIGTGAGSAASASTPVPTPSTGRVERLADAPSKYVPARDVDVWLPPGYPAYGRYAVLYMQDGQMLFDGSITWNHQEWRADEVAAALMAVGAVQPFIIVGIHNGGARRHDEYFPQKPFESLPAAERRRILAMRRPPDQPLFAEGVVSDAYLKFVVEELKPAIDARYAVYTDAAHTAVMGSSMGGLISLYAISEYPQVFGAAACLSTHWPGTFEAEHNPVPDAFFAYLRQHLPDPATHRLYFDHGTATLDAMYPALQAKADALVRARGYTAANWSTRRFEGAEHTEAAWSARLDQPLRFLFGRP